MSHGCMSLRFDILTLFPEMFHPVLRSSILKRAADKGLAEYCLTNLRDFATDAHETVADGLLEYPQYTRPRDFRGMAVPEVLLGGNHGAIADWRLQQRKLRTKQRRPDLWRRYQQQQNGRPD